MTSLGLRDSTLVGAVVMPTPCFYGDQMESTVSLLARVESDVDVDGARVTIVSGRGCVGRFAVAADDPNVEVLQNFDCRT